MEVNQSSPNPTIKKSKSNGVGRSITIKVIILFGMLLFMQIPVLMIRNLIEDRESLGRQSDEEIISSWGEELLLSQPKVEVDSQAERSSYALNINVNIDPQELKRGIFVSRVYNATVKYAFEFNRTIPEVVKPKKGYPLTYFKVPVEREQKIKGPARVTLNGETVDEANLGLSVSFGEIVFCIDSKYTPKKGDVVEITYNTTGSRGLQFDDIAGLGINTTIDVSSTWRSPNFKGSQLPDDRTLNEKGFKAQWYISSPIQNNSFGVELIDPVDHYRLTDRASKYALLFIALTFLAFFIAETVNKWRIHPVQYALVGAAMVVFYSLLLSFSEQVGFAIAYLISSAATILLISLYAITILRKNVKSAISIGTLLTLLYLFLYFVLQMEDYALMAGSILLFITVALAMYCLRNVKWYGENE